MRLYDGTLTKTVDETAMVILNRLIPNGHTVSTQMITSLGHFQFCHCSNEELKESIWKINPKKAPGNDLITAEIVRKAWSTI